jgi:hypothetical protein
MFRSSEEGRSYRSSLPKRTTKSTKKSLDSFYGGPFAGFKAVDGEQRKHHHPTTGSTDVLLNHDHIQSVSTAATTSLVRTPVEIIINSLFSRVLVLRNGKGVAIQPHFDSWLQTTFGNLARNAVEQILLYGIAVVVLAPPTETGSSKRRRGAVRAVERTSIAAAAVGAATDAASTLSTPVVLQLDDPEVTVHVEMDSGVRYYTVEHESIDSEVTETPLISVTSPPTSKGLLTSPLTSVLNELSALSTVEELFVETAFQRANPVNLLQKRHGPSAGGMSIADAPNLFFDSESRQIHDEGEVQRNERLIAMAEMLNKLQTENAPPITVTSGKSIKQPEVRTHLIPNDLESAAHSMYPASESLTAISEARKDLFLRISTLFSLPHGLTLGSGSSVTGSGPQFELFHQRLATLRSEVEALLSSVYIRMGLGKDSDSIKLQPHNPACRDTATITTLHDKGLLSTEVAQEMVHEILGLDGCHMMGKREPHDGERNGGGGGVHLALRSPRASTAPSEAGDKDEAH